MVDREEQIVRKILAAVAATWRLPALIALVAGLALAGAVAFTRGSMPASTTYLSLIQFVFPDAASGRYPNGATFSINELVDPVVLTTVYDQEGLTRYGLNRAEFYGGFSVRPYAPADSDTAERYRMLLADRRLSSMEKERLETQYKVLLDQSSRSTVELSFTVPRNFAIPDEIGRAIVRKVPAVWAQQTVDNRGILRVPGFSAADSILAPEEIDNLSLPMAILSALDGTRNLVRRIAELNTLSEQGTAAGILGFQDSESKKGIPDIERDIRNMELQRIFRLHHALARFQFKHGIDQVETGVARRVQDLEIEVDETTKRAGAMASSLNLYVDALGGAKGRPVAEAGRPGRGDPSAQTPGGGGTSVSSPGENIIDKIVQLQNSGIETDQRYVALMTSKQYDLMRRAIALRAEQVWWKDLQEALRAGAPREPIEEAQRVQLVGDLHAAVNEVNTIWATLTRIERIYAATRFTHSARLYNSNVLSRDVVRQGSMFDAPMGMIIALGMVATFLLMWVGRVLLHLRPASC